jgi:alkanesulfonate monooxygenase SsuD/methylene tetrahydromethanopterin reductase-like flavin-dependent oxidoreductase (luciferase family)
MKGWPAEIADFYRGVATIGDADTFGEEMQKLIDAGIDGVTLNLVPNGHDPEMVMLAGESATRAMG